MAKYRQTNHAQRMWVAQFGRCPYCTVSLPHLDVNADLTRDHVYPRINGHGRRRNVLLTHAICNNRKGKRHPYPCERLFLDITNDIAGRLSRREPVTRQTGE